MTRRSEAQGSIQVGVQAGTLRDFGTTLFTAKKRYPLRLIVFYDHGQKEPWILTTNLTPKDLNAYCRGEKGKATRTLF
jgi:hypothetical protein